MFLTNNVLIVNILTSVRSSEEAGAAVDATWSVDSYGEWVVDTEFVCRKNGL